MKFEKLFSLVVEEKTIIEEGYKEILAHIALLTAAGWGWKNEFDLRKKAKELRENPVMYSEVQKEVEQKKNDEKFNREVMTQYNDKILKQFQNKLETADPEYKPIRKDPDLTNKSSYKNLENYKSFIEKAKKYIRQHETIPGKKYNRVYKDNKGKRTVGIGHLVLDSDYEDGTFKPSDFIKVKGNDELYLTEDRIDQLFQQDIGKKLLTIRRQFLGYDNYPESLKIAILDGFFRGDLSESVKAKGLIKRAMEAHFEGKNRVAKILLKSAAKEYLNSKEYRTYSDPKAGGEGIARRMERNAYEIENALSSDHVIDLEKKTYL